MAHILAFINAALEWVNTPTNKTLLLVLGSWIWNRNSATVNKAIPALTGAASIAAGAAQLLVAAIAATFPQAGVHAAAYEVAASRPLLHTIGAALFGTLVPVAITIGAHSWPKNFVEWLADGARLMRSK